MVLWAHGRNRGGADSRVVFTDGWDGYPAARERLLRSIAARKTANPVVLGGDVHFAAACDLRVNFDDERSPVVASEFVSTSISSYGPSRARNEALLAKNPHIRFANSQRRGYTRHDIGVQRWEATFRGVVEPTDPQSRVYTVAQYVVEDGRPGVIKS